MHRVVDEIRDERAQRICITDYACGRVCGQAEIDTFSFRDGRILRDRFARELRKIFGLEL